MDHSKHDDRDDELRSVTLLGDYAQIQDVTFRSFLLNTDTLIYSVLFSILLASFATFAELGQVSFLVNMLIWPTICGIFLLCSYLMTTGFILIGPKLGLKRMFVPISSIPVAHVLYFFWQIQIYLISGQGGFSFHYSLREIAFLYVVIQIANIFFVRFSVPANQLRNQMAEQKIKSELDAGDDVSDGDIVHSKLRVGANYVRVGKDLVLANEVWSASADEHYLNVKTANGDIMVREKMNIFEAEMGDLGMKVHRSHWVSKDQVSGQTQEGRKLFVVMSDGSRIPLAASRQTEFETWLAKGQD